MVFIVRYKLVGCIKWVGALSGAGRYHITREALANGTLRLQYIRTADMTADILTKSLPIEAHRRHRHNMGLTQG
jgi:hypothetical protein